MDSGRVIARPHERAPFKARERRDTDTNGERPFRGAPACNRIAALTFKARS